VNELILAGNDLLTWMEAHAFVAGLMVVVMLMPAAVSWWIARRSLVASRDGVYQIEHRLSHLCSAVELLTDTTESGLQSAFAEIQYLAKTGIERAPKKPGLQTRVRRAARGGRSARQIAQTEGVSEGEVRLRLTLAGGGSPVSQPAPVQ
jgi:hypothetical protein